jgi:peptide/nickel transport system permease protein
MVLPIVAMVYSGFTVLSRFARTSMLDTISQDYVRTARAKGLSERIVVFRHAFRNSLISIVTLLGSLLPGMIGGSVIIEVIFTIDGMGKLGFQSILARDYPVIMAITAISAVLTLLGVLISDVLYSIVDPRISVE